MLDDDWLVSHEYQISLAHGSRNEFRYFFWSTVIKCGMFI
jgi:hypothetical protein